MIRVVTDSSCDLPPEILEELGIVVVPLVVRIGNRENCEMRACASNRNIDDCSQCHEPATCKHVETLQKMRSGALGAGLFVKTAEDVDRQQLVEKWTAELQSQWPCYILFDKEVTPICK